MYPGQQEGLTLTEILVAVVVLSIGLLGMAGIQMKGLRGSHNTFLRSQATALATDLAERIRANPSGITLAVSSTTNTNYGMVSFDETTDCSTVPTRCDSINGTAATTSCTAAEIAEYDIYTWMCGEGPSDTTNGVRNILPAGTTVTTTCPNDSIPPPPPTGDSDACSPGSTINILVNWNERALDTEGNAQAVNPQSLTMVVVP
jgi:type IV pilus assembly protein PilV